MELLEAFKIALEDYKSVKIGDTTRVLYQKHLNSGICHKMSITLLDEKFSVIKSAGFIISKTMKAQGYTSAFLCCTPAKYYSDLRGLPINKHGYNSTIAPRIRLLEIIIKNLENSIV